MPHRQLLPLRVAQHLEAEQWSRHAVRDLEVAIGFLRDLGKHRRNSVAYSVALLGALLSYSRPFTERADPAVNQNVAERGCFLSLAADLGADLHLHGMLLQMRDQIMALSDVVSLPAARLNARTFKYPDPRLMRITQNLSQADFQRLAGAMRVACTFFRAELDARDL
jgi:hypothetical protein